MPISIARLNEILSHAKIGATAVGEGLLTAEEILELATLALDESTERPTATHYTPGGIPLSIGENVRAEQVKVVTRSDWEARVMTMRAARSLASRLEEIAVDRSSPTGTTVERAQDEQSFRNLFARLTDLIASLKVEAP